jgi:hypothetical protein
MREQSIASLQLFRFGLGGGEDKLGMVVAPNVSTKKMAATGRVATPIQRCAVAHIFTGDP